MHRIISQGDCLGTVDILSGESDKVQILADTDFDFPLAEKEQPQIVLSGPGFSYAPVIQGAQAGWAYICIGEKTVGKVPAVYGQTVELKEIPKQSLWEKLFGGT